MTHVRGWSGRIAIPFTPVCYPSTLVYGLSASSGKRKKKGNEEEKEKRRIYRKLGFWVNGFTIIHI